MGARLSDDLRPVAQMPPPRRVKPQGRDATKFETNRDQFWRGVGPLRRVVEAERKLIVSAREDCH